MLQFRMVNMIVSTMALRKLGPFSIQCFTAQRFSQPSVSNFEIISHKFVIYWMICVKIEQYSLSRLKFCVNETYCMGGKGYNSPEEISKKYIENENKFDVG